MDQAVTRNRAYAGTSGLGAAWAAFAVGLLYAAISVYWGLGGSGPLDTVGASLTQPGRSASGLVVLAVWCAVALKLIAAVLPLLAVGVVSPGSFRRRRLSRALTWVEAAILTFYGLILTAVGLLVQAGVIGTQANADHRALAWHAYLWDPWFLVRACSSPPPCSAPARPRVLSATPATASARGRILARRRRRGLRAA